MARRKDIPFVRWVLYAFATLQFIRYYVVSTRFYLRMPLYLSGHERLPFQERILPIFLMWPINHWPALMHAVADRGHDPQTSAAATPETVAFYFLSLISFAVAGFFTVKLYRAVTATGILAPLVFPVFLIISMWTYVIHIDANYSYPYDMPSLAFFTAGLYCIYTRRFAPLLLIMAIGTLNRETTLFLIGIFLLDAASRPSTSPDSPISERFSLRLIPWRNVVALTVVWLAIKLTLVHHFAGNSNIENYNRIIENIYRLKIRLLPSLLNIGAYLLPVVWIYRRQIAPARFANYLYILPLWFAIMFYTGVILETRIYGELSAYVAISVVLLLEEHVLAWRKSSASTSRLILPPLRHASPQPALRVTTPEPVDSGELVAD